jgi:hypothetical protein
LCTRKERNKKHFIWRDILHVRIAMQNIAVYCSPTTFIRMLLNKTEVYLWNSPNWKKGLARKAQEP